MEYSYVGALAHVLNVVVLLCACTQVEINLGDVFMSYAAYVNVHSGTAYGIPADM